ncbi:hypothetical protein Tco_0079443 [Tanacetum coccineum]
MLMIHRDEFMMKAQVHVSKSSAISDVQVLPQKNIIDKITHVVLVIMPKKMLREIVSKDRRSHARTAKLIEAEARASCEAWSQSMDTSDTTRSEVRALRTTVLAQQNEIGDLQAADHRRHAQLTDALTLLRTLQTQMAALQSQQRPARDRAHPNVPEEAGSSS